MFTKFWDIKEKTKKKRWCHTSNWWLSCITPLKIINDEDDRDDKPVRVPIVLYETHARLVTGLWRNRSERISVILMTAVYLRLSSWNQIRWVSVLLDVVSWPAAPNQPTTNYSDDSDTTRCPFLGSALTGKHATKRMSAWHSLFSSVCGDEDPCVINHSQNLYSLICILISLQDSVP